MLTSSRSLLWLVAVSYACQGDASGAIEAGNGDFHTSATNVSMSITNITGDVCPSQFSEEIHSFMFSEECLAGMNSTEAANFGCPVTVVENLLTAFFKEGRVQNSSILPICFFAWFLLFVFGKVPKRKSLFCVWTLLQLATVVLYVLSLLAFILAYANLHWWFHGCMVHFGSMKVPFIHVILAPLAAFVPAGATRLGLISTLLFFNVNLHGVRAESSDSGAFLGVCLGLTYLLMGVLLCLVVVLGLLYWAVTLSFVGSLVCIGVAAPPFAAAVLLWVLWVLSQTKRGQRVFAAIGFPWQKLDEENSDAGNILSFWYVLCSVYLSAAPAIVFGGIVVWAMYAEDFDHSEKAAGVVYSFVFKVEGFEVPSFIDFAEFLGDPLSLMEHLANLPDFTRVPPEELLRGSTYFAVMGTMLGILRTVTITLPILLNWAEGTELALASAPNKA
mmetsp:Transcript_63099/g.150413  ORF Transcript_63099/g.150413 Transcript_63099/m.150413 type:complete len:445 (-) Transcript_63099:148-1482(-)